MPTMTKKMGSRVQRDTPSETDVDEEGAPPLDEEPVKRVNLLFPSPTYDQLLELKRIANATSISEVIRDAIVFYWWVAQRVKNGERIGLIDEDGNVQHVEFPHLFNQAL